MINYQNLNRINILKELFMISIKPLDYIRIPLLLLFI